MIKIKASYTSLQELERVIKVLKPYIKGYKVKPQKGKFKRVYIDIEAQD